MGLLDSLKQIAAGFRDHHEVRIGPNRIGIRNGRTGQTIERAAMRPFSSGAVLIADEAALQALLNAMIRDLEGNARFAMWPSATVMPAPGSERNFTPPEVSALRRIGDAMGYSRVEIGSAAAEP